MNPAARTIVPILGLLGLVATTVDARVHPHVFAEARLDVVLTPDSRGVKSLKHLWRFDDLFSSTVLVEFDQNGDLALDDTELQEVANTVYGSLADYDYFQIVTRSGNDVAMKPPAQLIASFQDNQLIILFESEPAEPLSLDGKLGFGVYDPTFYTAIDFIEDDNMGVPGLPANCQRAVIRPDPDEAIAQNQGTLTEQFFTDPSGTDMSKIFATRLELDCAAEG